MMSEEKKSLSISTLLVLAMTAMMPMAVATGFSNFERARHLLLGVLAGLALISWGVGVFRQRGVKIASPGTLILGGAFGVVVTASILWSSLPIYGAISVVMWAGLGVIFLVLVAPVGRAPQFRDWTTALAASVIAAGAMGIYDLMGGAFLNPVWRPSGVAGGFDSLGFASAFYALAIPLLAAAVAVSQGNRRRFMGLALILGALHFGLVVDGLSLGVLVGVMVVVAVVVRAASESVGPEGKVAMGVTFVALAIALIGSAMVERPTSESDAVDLPRLSPASSFDVEMASDSEIRWPYFASDRIESPLDQRYRSYLNSVTRGHWQKEPVLGRGAGGWVTSQTDVIHDGDEEVRSLFQRYAVFDSPHNDYGRVLVEQGILGLSLFLLWLAGIATAAVGGIRKGGKDGKERVIMWALVTTVLTGLVMMLFVPVLELGSSAVVWIGAAAFLVAYSARQAEDIRWLAIRKFGAERGIQVVLVLLCLGLGAAMIGPTVMNGRASLERGFGDHLMLRSQFAQAVPYYESAHEIYPAHPEVLYNIATAHMLGGDSREGYEAISEAVEMRSYDSRFLAQAALVNLQTDRVNTALQMGAEAVRTGPNYMRAYDVYSASLEGRARHEDSVGLFQAALDRDPPQEFRATIYARLGIVYDGQLDEPELALEYLNKAIEAMAPGPEREMLLNRREELDKRLQRAALAAEGKPIPPELMPAVEHDHDHGHDGIQIPEGLLPPDQEQGDDHEGHEH